MPSVAGRTPPTLWPGPPRTTTSADIIGRHISDQLEHHVTAALADQDDDGSRAVLAAMQRGLRDIRHRCARSPGETRRARPQTRLPDRNQLRRLGNGACDGTSALHAEATVTGGRGQWPRNERREISMCNALTEGDGREGDGTTRQLFAVGYAACFEAPLECRRGAPSPSPPISFAERSCTSRFPSGPCVRGHWRDHR